MKVLRNQQGYALLIVLFVIVIFVTLGTVFMAGSLNNARQEQTVDTSNQAVAAAEMGVNYYKTDFEVDLTGIEQEVIAFTQQKLNDLKSCIETHTDPNCDEEDEWLATIETIDLVSRELYLQKVITKISDVKGAKLNTDGIDHIDESLANATYTLKDVVSPASITLANNAVTEVPVELQLEGEVDGKTKNLKTLITIYIPATFLNYASPTVIDMEVEETITDVTYEDVFKVGVTTSCTELIAKLKENNLTKPYECKPDTNMELTELLAELAKVEPALDPSDFKVYVDDFKKFAECGNNCNNLNMSGLNVVVNEADTGAANNINNMLNSGLVVNGKLSVDNNLNNLGKDHKTEDHIVIIVKEIKVTNNAQNMENTSLLILGNATGTDAQMDFNGHVLVAKNSKVCIDTDRIDSSDITALMKKIQFIDGGQLIYYTSKSDYYLKLLTSTGMDRGNTDEHVVRKDSYSAFLETCGVSFTQKVQIRTEVPVPDSADNLFEFDVKYQ